MSDADEDEHKRQLSISMSLEHTGVAGPEGEPHRRTGDPAFQGELRCAARVVEGALVTVSAVMGVEVGTARAWRLADELGLARVVFVNMLDRERADFFRTLEALRSQLSTKMRRRAHPDRRRARADGDRRRAAHVRVLEPRGREGG